MTKRPVDATPAPFASRRWRTRSPPRNRAPDDLGAPAGSGRVPQIFKACSEREGRVGHGAAPCGSVDPDLGPAAGHSPTPTSRLIPGVPVPSSETAGAGSVAKETDDDLLRDPAGPELGAIPTKKAQGARLGLLVDPGGSGSSSIRVYGLVGEETTSGFFGAMPSGPTSNAGSTLTASKALSPYFLTSSSN